MFDNTYYRHYETNNKKELNDYYKNIIWLKNIKLINPKQDILNQFKDGKLILKLSLFLVKGDEVLDKKEKSTDEKDTNKRFDIGFKIIKYLYPNIPSELTTSKKIIEGDENTIQNLISFIRKEYEKKITDKLLKLPKKTIINKDIQPETKYKYDNYHSIPDIYTNYDNNNNDQQKLQMWLNSLQINYSLEYSDIHFTEDPLRNGYLLYKILRVINIKPVNFVKHPKTLNDVYNNINNCINV